MTNLIKIWKDTGLTSVFYSSVDPSLSNTTFQKYISSKQHIQSDETQQVSAKKRTSIRPRQRDQNVIDAYLFEWPKPWSDWLSKLSKGARVVFTYKLLSNDFGGKPDPIRSQFWRSLLQQLKWPKGTVSFWPCTDFPSLVLQPQFFWRGVSIIKPKYIVFWGSDLRDELFPASTEFFPNGWPGLSFSEDKPEDLILRDSDSQVKNFHRLESISL